MTEIAAMACLERLSLDYKSYQTQLIALGVLDALSHQLDSGAEEVSLALDSDFSISSYGDTY